MKKLIIFILLLFLFGMPVSAEETLSNTIFYIEKSVFSHS